MPRTRIITFLVALALLFPLTAYSRSPENARITLGQMNIPYTDKSFLHYVSQGDTVVVKLFLDAGMKPDIPNKDGMTALVIAAVEGHTATVQALLNKGAEV